LKITPKKINQQTPLLEKSSPYGGSTAKPGLKKITAPGSTLMNNNKKLELPK